MSSKSKIFWKNFQLFKIEIPWKFVIFIRNYQVVKNHRNYHKNSNFISTWARAPRAVFQPHVDANFKKSGRVWGGGAVSARRVVRAVVKWSPTDSLEKINTFWLLVRRHIFKTRFCRSKSVRVFFRRKKKRLAKVSEASFKADTGTFLGSVFTQLVFCFREGVRILRDFFHVIFIERVAYSRVRLEWAI